MRSTDFTWVIPNTRWFGKRYWNHIPYVEGILTAVLRRENISVNVIDANENDLIAHRDISPDNILLSYDEHKPVGILGDFGIAKLLDQINSLPGAGGRYLYFAPECFMNIYLPTSDVFRVLKPRDKKNTRMPTFQEKPRDKFLQFLAKPRDNFWTLQNVCF